MSLVKSNHDQQDFTRDGSVGRAAPRFYFFFCFFAGDGLGLDHYSVGGVGGFIKDHTEWIIYWVPWLIWGTAQFFQFKCREKRENCRIF